MYNHAQKELGKIDKDVFKLSGKAIGVEPMNLEAPENEDQE
jgi:hypothetical protein